VSNSNLIFLPGLQRSEASSSCAWASIRDVALPLDSRTGVGLPQTAAQCHGVGADQRRNPRRSRPAGTPPPRTGARIVAENRHPAGRQMPDVAIPRGKPKAARQAGIDPQSCEKVMPRLLSFRMKGSHADCVQMKPKGGLDGRHSACTRDAGVSWSPNRERRHLASQEVDCVFGRGRRYRPRARATCEWAAAMCFLAAPLRQYRCCA